MITRCLCKGDLQNVENQANVLQMLAYSSKVKIYQDFGILVAECCLISMELMSRKAYGHSCGTVVLPEAAC